MEASFSSSASELVGQNFASPTGLKSLRDKAILELLFSTGLRVSELCALNRDSFSEAKSGEISIRGKGGKIRVVFISDSAKQAVKNYLNKRTDTEEALFISFSSVRIGGKTKQNFSRFTLPRSASAGSDASQISLCLPPALLPVRWRECLNSAIEAGISKKSLPMSSAIVSPQIYYLTAPTSAPSKPSSPLQHHHHSNLHPCDG